jgi:hypothetical protein
MTANFPKTQQLLDQAQKNKGKGDRFEICLERIRDLIKTTEKQLAEPSSVSQLGVSDRQKMAEDLDLLKQYLSNA